MTEGGWDAQSMEDSGLFTHCQSFRALGRILRGLETGRAPAMSILALSPIGRMTLHKLLNLSVLQLPNL